MAKNRKGKYHIVPKAEQATPDVQAELAAKVETTTAETTPAETVSTETTSAETPAKKPTKARYVSGRFTDQQVIRLKVAGNPKRPSGKSYVRFGLHQDGLTVAEYVQKSVDAGNKAALAHDDLRWDAAHGFIEVEAPAPKAE